MDHSKKSTTASDKSGTSSKHRRREEGQSSNVLSCNKQPLEVTNRSKILSSSGFYEFFLGKYGNGGVGLNVGTSLHSKMDQNGINRKGGSSSSSSSDHALKARDLNHLRTKTTTPQDLSAKNIPSNSTRSGINLRQWLVSNKNSDVRKIDKLFLFRKIVQMVNAVHYQGTALLDLKPSSLVLSERGDLKYIGRLMQVPDDHIHDRAKKQKVNVDRPEICLRNGATHQRNMNGNSAKPDLFRMESNWYACQERLQVADLPSFNVFCLGLMLVEFLSKFESVEARSMEMFDLHHRILPVSFLSKYPKEAGLCFWLLHPDSFSRPKTRDILQCELMQGLANASSRSGDEESSDGMVEDFESDLLLDFFDSLKRHKQKKVCDLLECIDSLEEDIKEIERMQNFTESSNAVVDAGKLKDHIITENSFSQTGMLKNELFKNMSQLENAYFSAKNQARINTERSYINRSDKDVLRRCENRSDVRTPDSFPTSDEQCYRIGCFFNGICKFARYSEFKVCGTLRNEDILNSHNVISSLSLDRDEELIAASGVSKTIKIFELASLLNDSVDVHYPVVQMYNESKFSSICWNNYIRNYIASADYDGLVQVWDVNTGQAFSRYKEHQKRAWSVDFCQADPTKFASGSDDCSVRIWSINEKKSFGCIRNQANVCCVQCSSFTSNFLTFGSADSKIYCYDLRHTRVPWCTLSGHDKAVSYVRFLDSETVVSSSVDGTLKLWDLKKTSYQGLSPNACNLTFRGHTNEKNFVGLAVLNGFIVCGSETNEVYAYYKSLPMPITCHKLGGADRHLTGEETGDDFVSSVCWIRKSEKVVAANSNGNIEILSMV